MVSSIRNFSLLVTALFFSTLIFSQEASSDLDELTLARESLIQAETLQAKIHSPKEFNDAKRLLTEAQKLSADDSSDPALLSEKFQESIRFSQAASRRAFPEVYSESKKKTLEAELESDRVYAESLAADYFLKGKKLMQEAEQSSSTANLELNSIEEMKDTKLQNLKSFQFSKTAIKVLQKWNQAAERFEKAKSLSLSQSSALLESQMDVLDDLQSIQKYSPQFDSQKIESLRQEFSVGEKEIEDGNIKKGFFRIESLRESVQELLESTLKPYTRNQIDLLQEKLAQVENEFAKKHQSQPFSDSLMAARESNKLAETFYAQARYEEALSKLEDTKEYLQSADVLEPNLVETDSEVQPKKLPKRSKVKTQKQGTSPKIPKRHRVQKKSPAETLWSISIQYYKTPRYWKKIFKANQKVLSHPDRLQPGQILFLPR